MTNVAEHAAFILGRNAVLANPDGCGLIARPAPDEARRLVDAYGCDAAMHGALGATGDTRTALLRALGVQA